MSDVAAPAPLPPGTQADFLRAIERHRANDLAQAIALYRAVVAAAPGYAPAWTNLSAALKVSFDLLGAAEAARQALRLAPDNADAWNNLGMALMAQDAPEQAARAYRKALSLDPKFDACACNLGLALAAAGEPGQAVAAFRRALAINPEHVEALVQCIHHSLQICDWDGLDPLIARLSATIRADRGEVNPFAILGFCPDPGEQLLAGRNYSRRVEKSVAGEAIRLPPPSPCDGRRLRIGYLCADFQEHPTAFLAVEMFEAHDRARYETFAYSIGAPNDGRMRRRLRAAFDHFVDLAALPTAAAAQRIADDRLDLLVDAMGYTRNARPGILALRPAPVQAAYLAYPATTGAEFIDYALVDGFVAPAEAERFFSETPARIDRCYQPGCREREVASPASTRADHGLPDDGVVFCCFNQIHKITPDAFSIWMRLLRETPRSVLWLIAFDPTAAENIKKLAAAQGVAAERLVFAEKRPNPQHLERIRHADLFLDTFHYNAHTTASDSLRAGVPVVTFAGRTFAARVAGSLLTALDLPDLIADSPTAYHALARELAHDAERRSAVRDRLLGALEKTDLFDGAACARRIERVFDEMVSRGPRRPAG